MKYVLLLYALLLSNCFSEEYISFTRSSNGTNVISVPAGETWKVVNWWGVGTGSSELFRVGDTSIKFIGNYVSYTEEYVGDSPVGIILKGPATIVNGQQLPLTSSDYRLVIKKISSVSTSSNISATSVVIPTSASGDVDVKMEQSADNVTWTECLPGTYNSSTVKRFFRLRAVEK
jgi:hypothetical protein